MGYFLKTCIAYTFHISCGSVLRNLFYCYFWFSICVYCRYIFADKALFYVTTVLHSILFWYYFQLMHLDDCTVGCNRDTNSQIVVSEVPAVGRTSLHKVNTAGWSVNLLLDDFLFLCTSSAIHSQLNLFLNLHSNWLLLSLMKLWSYTQAMYVRSSWHLIAC